MQDNSQKANHRETNFLWLIMLAWLAYLLFGLWYLNKSNYFVMDICTVVNKESRDL